MTLQLERFENNPILRAKPENAWEAQNVSNAGATIHDGKVYLLYRAEGFEPRSGWLKHWPRTRIGMAISSDGFNIDYRSEEPVLDLIPGDDWEGEAVEDPRISKIGDLYYIVYTGVGFLGEHLRLATTRDFMTFERHGAVMPEFRQRTSTLLPEKIDGNFVMIHRLEPNMWVSTSEDMKKWSSPQLVMAVRPGRWDEKKLGAGAQPIKTELGWLLFTHGVDRNNSYALGLAVLDLKDPTKLIYRHDGPILSPEKDYELETFFEPLPEVVYTCGAVEKDGDYIVYYGCGDRCLAAAGIAVDKVMQHLFDSLGKHTAKKLAGAI